MRRVVPCGAILSAGWEHLKGRKGSRKTRKAELCGPASLLRCRSARPFGTFGSAPRDLSAPWSRALPHGCPQSQRRDLTTALIYRRVATTWPLPWPGWNQLAVRSEARRTLSAPPHGTAAKPPDRGTPRLLFPPPSAAHGTGRPRACLALASLSITSRCLRISPPTPSTTGQLTFRRIHLRARHASTTRRLSPLSTGARKNRASASPLGAVPGYAGHVAAGRAKAQERGPMGAAAAVFLTKPGGYGKQVMKGAFDSCGVSWTGRHSCRAFAA
jgi:hypothetical protein